MKILSYFVKTVVGLVFGLISAAILSPAFAAFHTDGENSAPVGMILAALGIVVLCIFAPTIRRAFGRGFLSLGAASFLLPISTMLLSGRVTMELVDASNDAATAVGATIGTGLMTGMSAFIGFFLGAVFLIIGLVLTLGGRREVVVVEKHAT